MSTVRLITQNGFEQELQGVTLLSIDGVPIEQILQPDITNHEHRIRAIEATLANMLVVVPEPKSPIHDPQPQLSFGDL